MTDAINHIMRFFLLLLFLAFGMAGLTQTDTTTATVKKPYHIKMGLGAGTARNFGGYFSVISSKNRFAAFDLNHSKRKSADQPQNYNGQLICFIGRCIPKDELALFSVMGGRYFPVKAKSSKFGISAGPSVALFDDVKYTYTGGFLSGYSPDYTKSAGFGVAFKASYELRLWNVLWLEPFFYANLNTLASTYSVNLYLNFETPWKNPVSQIRQVF